MSQVKTWVSAHEVLARHEEVEAPIGGMISVPYDPPAWTEKANCIGAPDEWFYGDPDRKPALTRAEASWIRDVYCTPCPVRLECLVGALLRNEPCGIWGGMTKRERARIRRMIKSGQETWATIVTKINAGETLVEEVDCDE